jgi:formate hydrogenlyase transcriptional activator
MMLAMAAPGHEFESKRSLSIIDSVPSLIHTAKPDGYLDYFNQHWLDYLGIPMEGLLGWKWTAAIHPEDIEAIVIRWRSSISTGEPFLHEARVRRADGQYRWILHHKVALRDEHGEIVRWYGSSIDIEDRRRAEERLRKDAQELQRSEFYLAEGQRLAHMGSWAFDPAGFDYWSPELFRMHGLDPTRKPPTVQEYLDCIHPQDRESMANLIKGLSAKASPFDATKRIVRPNGEVRYIRCVGAPVVENQSLKKYVGSALDVTEHELVTQELRRREAYLAQAQRLSHTGSFGWKPDDGEVVWSDETYRIFEYDSKVKPSVDSVLQRIHPRDRALAQEVIDGASQTGADFEHEYRLLMPDGRVKHAHAIAHTVQNASGDREFIGAVTDITERKTTEDKIRRLVEAGILGIFIGNVEGEIVEPNQAFLQMLQYGREDLVSGRLRWTDLTPAEWRERDERALTEALATGVFQPYEKQFLRKDGSRLPVLIGGALFQSGNEGVVFVLDLSEQKRTEAALRRSESYLAEAQRLSLTGSFGCRLSTGEMFWSEETFRIYGYDRSTQPAVERVLQRVHPEDRALVQERIGQAYRDGKDCHVECRLLLPDDSVKHVRIVAHASRTDSGIIEFIGAVMDVTERKTAEGKIREQEMEFRQILDLVPQLVSVYGPNHVRIYANRVMLDYLGLSLEVWRGRFKFGESIHPDDWEGATSHFDRLASSGASFELEVRLRKGDGSYRWFLARCNPVCDDQGQIMRWYVACTDIDDRKRAEQKLQEENIALREEVDKASMFEEIVGTSRPLKTVLSRIAKVGPTDSTVMITGETGTGKELIARAVHKRSKRSGRPFISVNCAALAPTLVSSELFGHEKGAFTGATQRRLGRFEMADGGTIFLDEVGELLPDTQAALLRVLQEREFERVGGGQPVQVDVRVIAATNRDLNAAVTTGTFRQDLLYRLNVFPIEMPPLRERKDDILILVEYFVQRYANRAGRKIRLIDQRALDLLQSYDWPGNIRELQNIIERSIILSSADVFSVDELWLSKRTFPQASRVEMSPALNAEPRSEREIIEAALAETRGRVSGPSGAAAKLRTPPSTLETRIKALKINKQQFKFL